MAQVPYQPYATATPEAGSQTVDVHAPPAAFGVNIAEAIQGFGGSAQKVGDELWSRAEGLKDLQNEKDARDASTAYSARVAQKIADFETKEGQASKDALPGFLADLDRDRIAGRAGLGTLNAQKMYDADTSAILRSATMLGARRAGEQFKQGIIASNKSAIDLLVQSWHDPSDPAEYDQKIKGVNKFIDDTGQLSSWTKPQIDDLKLHKTSELRATQIASLAKMGDIEGALTMYEQHKADILQDEQPKVEAIVYGQNRVIGTTKLAQHVWSEDKSYKEMADEVHKLSPQYAHGDPQFEPDAIRALQLWNNQQRYTIEQERRTNLDTIESGFRDANSPQELFADPARVQALYRLKQQDRDKVMRDFVTSKQENSKANSYYDFTRLKGMAVGDNAAREAFLETDLYDPKIQLNPDDRQKLIDMRKSMTKNLNEDTRVTRAMALLRNSRGTQMNALGVFRRDNNSPDTYDHFVGTLQEALEIWQQEKGSRPSDSDIQDVIGPQIMRTTPSGWFFKSDKLISDQFTRPDTVPQEYKDKAIAAAVKQGLPVPSDGLILRAYAAQEFKSLYGEAPTTVKPDQNAAGSSRAPTVPQSR